MIELRRFCPSLRAVKLHSSDQEERKRLMQTLAHQTGDVDVVVTTYEMAKSPETARTLSLSWWRYLVIDEGHVIKNDASLISQSVRRIHFAHALLLTGTPLQNNLHELWSLLNFLYPDVFPKSEAFDTAFELNANKVDRAQLVAASNLLQPFMLRRTKEEVEKGMPPKLETTISCPLSEMQVSPPPAAATHPPPPSHTLFAALPRSTCADACRAMPAPCPSPCASALLVQAAASTRVVVAEATGGGAF